MIHNLVVVLMSDSRVILVYPQRKIFVTDQWKIKNCMDKILLVLGSELEPLTC